MINNSRFSVAIHALMMMAQAEGNQKITSNSIAKSTGMNAVTIRHVFQKLKAAGLIEVKPGPGGAKLAINPTQVTLYDIYAAVEDNPFADLFRLNQTNSEWCPVGRNINDILSGRFEKVREAASHELGNSTLSDLLNELDCIETSKDLKIGE